MPSNLVKSIAKKHDIKIDDLEADWTEAKDAAADEGHEENWPYVMQIFKKIVKGKYNIDIEAEKKDLKESSDYKNLSNYLMFGEDSVDEEFSKPITEAVENDKTITLEITEAELFAESVIRLQDFYNHLDEDTKTYIESLVHTKG